MLYAGWDVLWVDFLHTNPYRSHLNALISPFVFGVVGGVWLTVDTLGALVFATLAVYFALRYLKRIPVALIVALVPIFLLLAYLQDNAFLNLTWYTTRRKQRMVRWLV
ncbi:hypothetical protein JQ543_28210 [Bradyrhizobium diazoefficiens]|nr:hypothetical protein [Bradyrhizobium diazoefficiens]MBR0851655.1 hypothetical protein [Bradyrhizobium diazoefficiens]